MTRISLVEQYDNKDVIQQIYRLKDLVETGTVADIQIAEASGVTTVTLTMNDGTVETYSLPSDYITQVTSSQSGTTVTLNFVYASGATDTITFNGSAGDASATPNTLALRDGSARVLVGDAPANDSSDIAANTRTVQNALNAYTPMVRTTGIQTIVAQKIYELPYGDYTIKVRGSSSDVTAGTYQGNIPLIGFFDKNDVLLAYLRVFIQSDGRATVNLGVRNADGTTKSVLLGDGNP